MASTEGAAEVPAEEQQIHNNAPQEGGGVDDEVCVRGASGPEWCLPIRGREKK